MRVHVLLLPELGEVVVLLEVVGHGLHREDDLRLDLFQYGLR